MGYSYEILEFWDAGIVIAPHSATEAKYLGKKVPLEDWAKGEPYNLWLCEETGELTAFKGKPGTPDYEFIEGPEV